jgi:hypothetical protein
MSRNAIFNALLALGQAIEPAGAGSKWGESGRRLKSIDAAIKPALFQIEPEEDFQSRLGQMPKREFGAMWIIYHEAGKDQAAIPAEYSSDLIDLIEAKLAAPVHRQSLDGQAYAAFINGKIRKYEGDDDGLSLIIVPISILVP